jgi:L-fucose isomerase-like protein
MERLRVRFVPAHREPLDQTWAEGIRERCLKAFSQNKMIVTNGEATKSNQRLRGSWSWVTVPNLELLYATLIERFVHHANLIHGDYSSAIADACDYLGVETVEV